MALGGVDQHSDFAVQVDGVILFSTIEAKVVHFLLTSVEFNPEITARNRFRWGLLFAWLPLMFFIVPTAIAIIHGFDSQRATGLVAVAGGLSEVLATVGHIVIVGSEHSAVLNW